MADFGEIVKLPEPGSCLSRAVAREARAVYTARPGGEAPAACTLVGRAQTAPVLASEAFHEARRLRIEGLAERGAGAEAASLAQAQFWSVCNYYQLEDAGFSAPEQHATRTPRYTRVRAECLLKVFFPQTAHNFQGLVLGPRGRFLEETKQFLGAQKVNLRGRGSQRLATTVVNEGDAEELHMRLQLELEAPDGYHGAALTAVRAARLWTDVARRAMGPDALNYYKRQQLDWTAPQRPCPQKREAPSQAVAALFGDIEARWQRAIATQDAALAKMQSAVSFYFQCLAEAKRAERPGAAAPAPQAPAEEQSEDLLPPGLD